MPFPFAFHANFEDGSKDNFDSETDTGNRLDYPGPQQLIRDQMSVFPHRGAYCMRVNLGKNSTDAYVSETVTWAADSTNHIRFEVMIGDDVQLGNDGDLVDLMVLRSASADEGAVVLARVEPAGIVIGLRDASGTVLHYLSPEVGDWMCLEIEVDVDAGGGDDGSIILRHGDDQIRMSGLDQAALTGVRFGAMNQSGDLQGHVYFDEILFDEARLYPDGSAHNMRLDGETMPMFKSGFVFIGEGQILGCQLIDGGSGDCILRAYDTDDVNHGEHAKQEHLRTTTANSVVSSQPLADGQYLFSTKKGCYLKLEGTNPQAIVRLGKVDEFDYGEDDDDDK